MVEAAKLMVYAAVCFEDSTAKVRSEGKRIRCCRATRSSPRPRYVGMPMFLIPSWFWHGYGMVMLCSCVLFGNRPTPTAAALKCGGLFHFQNILSGLSVFARVGMSDEQECGDESLKASPESVPWLARLALTRSTVIMPMTNSIGYYNTVRCDVSGYYGTVLLLLGG